jgi:Fic family protein
MDRSGLQWTPRLEEYLKTGEEPPLIKLAIAHYQFETIHPFRDGNGRLGRLMISLWLQREKILMAPMLYLSAFFERHQQRYYDALLKVSTDGAWEEWITFFLEGVSTQSKDAVQRAQKLVDLRAAYRGRMTGPRMPANLTTLIDDLFVVPATSVPAASRILGVTYQAARASVDKLVNARILKPEPIQIGGTGYYIAPEILALLEAQNPDAVNAASSR